MSLVYLVTGSSRGLGRSITRAALTTGHRVLATARRPEQLDDLVIEFGDRIHPFALDVTDYDAARAAVAAAVSTFGRLDVVVNNAGYANLASVEDITIEDFRAQVDTNFFGVVNVTKAALPVLREQGSGHVIQISSLGGRIGNAGVAAYQAAKFAVGGFSESLAQEVAPLGIAVTVLEPGGMRTDWAGSSMEVPPISAPYLPTVGAMAELFSEGGDHLGGDPDKVAQVVLEVADMQQPPDRLLLGTDAFTYARLAAAARTESDDKWRDLSASTDADDSTSANTDPLRRLA
jgi:NAD(P)-dependent dehydrogenase (short-subunit alcohol dehydrogenase family)